MTLLIVTLSPALPTAATLCAGVLSHDGRTVFQPVEAPLVLLPTPAGTEIVAVVPTSRLSWHRLALPRGALKSGLFQEGSAGRLRAVLDGLLARPDVRADQLAGYGLSQAGYWLPRALAFEAGILAALGPHAEPLLRALALMEERFPVD